MATGHGAKWPRKLETAVACVLSEPTLKEAAKKAGIDEKTLKAWMRRPEFADLLREGRQRAFNLALSRLQAVSLKAVAAAEKALRDKNPGPRLRAAGLVLANALKAAELLDLDERLAAVEATLKARKR